MARTSTRDSTGTWLFPCATEVELCFVDPPKEWWHYDDEPSTGAAFDLQVLQRMIAARRKARNGVVQVERLTIQNHSQTWDPSTLSPELITWFTVNVPTFVFKGELLGNLSGTYGGCLTYINFFSNRYSPFASYSQSESF